MKKSMVTSEWKQLLKTRKLIVPMIAILFIPVLYAGMFLWAFWDPYANMEDLPVAIVNLDEGAEMDGEQLQLGRELTDTLVKDQQFKFKEVKKEIAEKALENQEYYVVIEIPENFSQHATTLLDNHPEKLTIIYKPNEGFNFLSAQIGETAMDRIRAEVNKEVAATYAEKLFDSIAQLGDGFGEAADGTGELKEGTEKLTAGSAELKGYLETLASSTVILADGTDELARGAEKAATGAKDLNSGLGELKSGSSQLVVGASQASSGATDLNKGIANYTDVVQKLASSYAQIGEKEQQVTQSIGTLADKSGQLHSAANELASGASSMKSGINNLSAQLSPMLASLPPEQQQALVAALDQLKAGSSQLETGINSLAGGASALSEGATSLKTGANQIAGAHKEALAGMQKLNESSSVLTSGAQSLATGNATLSKGLTDLDQGVAKAQGGSAELANGLIALIGGSDQLKAGTGTLASKSRELADGSSTLVEGTEQVDEGVATLQEKLTEAKEAAGEVNPTEETYEMAATPVEVDKEEINKVPNYGTGFAPYFLSLGLFVGALLLSIVFPLVEPATRPTGALAWFTSKVSVLAVVGFIQAMIAVAIVTWGLGMEVVNMPLFIATAILTSYTFIAIVQLLVSVMSDTGRFVAILILILQLTTSAGTFPLELIPAPLQWFNTILPMTYSVQAFKATISTGDFGHLWASNGILIGFTVVCLALTFGYFALIFSKRYSKEVAES